MTLLVMRWRESRVEEMLPVEVDYGLDLIVRKAILARNEGSVRIGHAGARTPDGKLAGPYAKPAAETLCGNAGPGCPEVDEPYDFLTRPRSTYVPVSSPQAIFLRG